MATTGKLAREVEIKCDLNMLYEIYKNKPNDMAIMSPDKVQSCNLVAGQWGASGSVIFWNFIIDGQVHTAKEIIEVVDDELHKVVYKVIEGDAMVGYNALSFTIVIQDMGDKMLVIWTVEFEKVNASIPDPTYFLDFLCAVTIDVDAYILKHP